MGLIVPFGVGSGSENYEDLQNLPSINGVTLTGNKTAADLGISGDATVSLTDVTDEWNVSASDGSYFTEMRILLFRYGEKISMVSFDCIIKDGAKLTAGNVYDIAYCTGEHRKYVSPIGGVDYRMVCIIGSEGGAVGYSNYFSNMITFYVTKTFTAGDKNHIEFTTPCFINSITSV